MVSRAHQPEPTYGPGWAHSGPKAGPRPTTDRPELLRCNSFRRLDPGWVLFADAMAALPRTSRVRPPQRVDSSRLVSTGTSTVTDWARTPAAAHPALGPADHGTPRRSLVTTSPRTWSRTRPAGVTGPLGVATTMGRATPPAPARAPPGCGMGPVRASEHWACAVPSPARQGRGRADLGATGRLGGPYGPSPQRRSPHGSRRRADPKRAGRRGDLTGAQAPVSAPSGAPIQTRPQGGRREGRAQRE